MAPHLHASHDVNSVLSMLSSKQTRESCELITHVALKQRLLINSDKVSTQENLSRRAKFAGRCGLALELRLVSLSSPVSGRVDSIILPQLIPSYSKAHMSVFKVPVRLIRSRSSDIS